MELKFIHLRMGSYIGAAALEGPRECDLCRWDTASPKGRTSLCWEERPLCGACRMEVDRKSMGSEP